MSMFKKTYKIAKTDTKSLSWEEYERTVIEEWQNLLNTSKKRGEKDFQTFFEEHPCMIPRPHDVFGRGAHGAFPAALISQPVLHGLGPKIPDFMWLMRDSSAFFAILIEIEDPNKPWAIKNGQPSANLTQAINQLRDWKAWFEAPNNKEIFIRNYKIPPFFESRAFIQKYILIYGRRDDPTLTPEVNKKRIHNQNENETFMTFDRLQPNSYLRNYMTVKLKPTGYHALHVPPTLQLRPGYAEDFSFIQNREQAVNKNKYLSKERKEFINSRWAYWDNWVKNDSKGMISSGDVE